jgi:hypothetical protein
VGPTGPPAVGYDSTGAPYILTATAPDGTTQPASARLVTEAAAAVAAQAMPRYATDPAYASADTMTLIATPTYDGSGMAVHPSVVFFADGWNGYRYWMAMTPYPNGNNIYENPSILASQDGTTWTVPPGLTNPVSDTVAVAGQRYNSDPNLVLGPDGKLHLFYRYFNANEYLLHMTSSDGITWSASEIIYSSDPAVRRLVAPTVVYEASTSTWVMYAVDIIMSPRKVVRLTAASASGPWTAIPTVCTITGNAGEPWHVDVHKVGGEWQMLVMDGGSGGGDLWAAVSQDGLTWTAGPAFIARGVTPFGAYYKSAFLPAIRKGQAGWDAWIGGAAFIASGSTIERGFVSFSPPIPVDPMATYVADVLAAKNGLPPWLVSDTFARSNSAGIGTAETGQAWTASSGTFNISNKAAVASAALNTRAYVEAGSAEMWASVKVASALNAGTGFVIGRLADASNYYRLGYNTSSGRIEIQVVIAGAVTKLAEYVAADPTSAGDVLGLRCTGSTLTAYRNGVALGSITDSSVSGTKAGIQTAVTTVLFQNFNVRSP